MRYERSKVQVVIASISPGRVVGLAREPLYANAIFLWMSTAVTALGGFIFWVLAAHRYSSAQVGLASATISAITFLGTVTSLGLGNGLIRYLPGAREARTYLINLASTLAILAGICGAIIFLEGLPLWSPDLSYLDNSPVFLLAFVIFVAVYAAHYVPLMTLMALRSARYILLFAISSQAVRVLLPLPLVSLGAFGLVVASGLATLVGAAMGYALLTVVERSYRLRPAFHRSSAAALLPYGLANHGADLALLAPGLLLPLLAVGALGNERGGRFYIGYYTGAFLLSVVQALATSLFAEGSHNELGLMASARRALMCAILISGIGAGLMILIGGRLLMIFGSGYSAEATGLLRLVALSALPASVIFISLAILRVRKQARMLLIVAWSATLLTLGLSYALMLTRGIVGAGIGVLGGQSLGALVCLYSLARMRSRPISNTS